MVCTTANIAEADFKSPGRSAADAMLLYPTGMAIKRTHCGPQIGDADFDAAFQINQPTDLEMREGMGLVSLCRFNSLM